MPASSRLRTAGAVVAGVLLATVAPGTPAHAITPPITVAMSSTGAGAPGYEIRIRNDTDGTVRTTVRQELPEGAVPARVSEGGQTIPSPSGRATSEVVWQVQLAGRATAVLTTTLAGPPPGATTVTAPTCAFVANGSTPYDCATATWTAQAASGAAGSAAWWRTGPAVAGAAGVLALLVVLAGVLWIRRRRRGAARTGDTAPEPATATASDAGARDHGAERRVIRRGRRPTARATARVRGDAKIPAPAGVRAATGHRDDAVPNPDGHSPDGADATAGPGAPEGPAPRTDAVPDGGAPVPDGGLVGIAGGARYVGRAPIPPRAPAPAGGDAHAGGPDGDAPDRDAPTDLPAEEPAEVPARVVGRAPKPRTSPPIRGIRRPRPPAWVAVGIAALLAVALATGTAWTGTSRVNAISDGQQPSSGAWVGRTVAGPVGTSLRESAFEFTVYRLDCPPGPAACQAIVGVRNLTDRSQPWYGQLQRAYLPGGDWVSADVPATRIANAGTDPFAAPVPAGERMIVPLVFGSTGSTPPTRIELRSAVFSAGVSVDVPH
jgi:hypothetical protein